MGNCATSPETAEEYQKYIAAEKEISLESDKLAYNLPDGSSSLNPEDLNRINNENKEIRLIVKIDRIKVRNVGSYQNLFCKFKFADNKPMKTHVMVTQGSYWRSQFSFDYVASEGLKSLREKTLDIELWSSNQQKENETCIGRASISIITICQGPFHIDYQLINNKRQPCGRISFNCTMEQQCVWGLKFVRATIRLKDGGDLNMNAGNLWSIVASTTRNEIEELYHSSDTSIPVITNQVAELDADKKHQLISLSWKENELFVVGSNCTFREFVREPLKLQLRNSYGSTDNNYSVFGECWISLEKAYSLFQRHPDRAAELRHHLWNNGLSVGEVSLFYQFTDICLVQQLLSGVNSENGISAGSTVIVSEASRSLFKRDNQEIPPQVNEIIRLYKTFIELKTASLHNDKEQVDILERIIGYLRATDKDKYRYQSESSLRRTQSILLDILDTLSITMWDMTYTVKNVVFEVIFRLLKRGELSDLSLLGFDPAKQGTEEPKEECVIFASNLRRVMLNILQDVLLRINEKGISQRLSVYCSRIISICMFRIPAFGDEVISVLWDNDFQVSVASPRTAVIRARSSTTREYAGSSCSLFGGTSFRIADIVEDEIRKNALTGHIVSATIDDMKAVEGGVVESKFKVTSQWLASVMHTCKLHRIGDSTNRDSDDLLQKLLDWRPIESAVLTYNEEHNIPTNDTDFFLDNSEWKMRISMKGNLYYLIAEAWLQKVLGVMTNLHREIQWSSIRGYNELLLSYAEQLERVPLSSYNDSMTKVMRTFLSNENTLSLFVGVLIKKTRPYNIQEVSNVIDLIDSLFCSYRRWMDRLERSRHPNSTSVAMKLPSTFSDYPFMDGIIQLLHSDMNQVIVKTIELLYHHWDLLREGQRHRLYVEILGTDLYKRLFLHWNVYVRQFFYYLLVYWLLQVSTKEKKGRVDVYSFLTEFSKAHMSKPYSVKFSNINTIRFYHKQCEITKTGCTIKDIEITDIMKKAENYSYFCEHLDIFSLTDFKDFCRSVLSDFTDTLCSSLIDYLQCLSVVYRVTDGAKTMFCCSPDMLKSNYDCYLFSPKTIDFKLPFYQQQVLISHFYSFLRDVRRVAMDNIGQKKANFVKYQASLQKACTACHNEAINKFSMEQLLIDKIVNLDMKSLYEQSMQYTEMMDFVMMEGNTTIPKNLKPYAFNAILTFDDLFKKHERDQARNNNDIPYLHWQTVFPTSLLSSWD